MTKAYDLAIIGSGGAAFAAAIRGRDLGAEVVMIERGTLGGTCVNIGCVPSKTLIRAGETLHQAATHPFAGIPTSATTPDLAAAVSQKDELVASLRKAKYEDLLGAHDIDLIRGEARFSSADVLVVNGEEVRAEKILIATGSRPETPAIPGLADSEPLTSTSALDLKEIPERLVVIGGGYIALEMGELFANLGSKVTMLVRSTIMRHEEPEVADTMREVFAQRGLQVLEGAEVNRVERSADGVRRVSTTIGTQSRDFSCDQILVATGRRPNTEALDLAAAGVEVDRQGAIVAGPDLATTNPLIFAAGDVVAGAPKLVYVAARMGGTAASNALTGAKAVIDYRAMPRVTFTSPQIAAVGLTDAQVIGAGVRCSCRTLPLSAVPRAIVNRDTQGFIKLVADADSRKVLGATVVAEGAGDVIQAAVYAVQFGLTIDQLAVTWAPYLTMSEGLRLAAQIFDRDISELSCCAA